MKNGSMLDCIRIVNYLKHTRYQKQSEVYTISKLVRISTDTLLLLDKVEGKTYDQKVRTLIDKASEQTPGITEQITARILPEIRSLITELMQKPAESDCSSRPERIRPADMLENQFKYTADDEDNGLDEEEAHFVNLYVTSKFDRQKLADMAQKQFGPYANRLIKIAETQMNRKPAVQDISAETCTRVIGQIDDYNLKAINNQTGNKK